MQPTPTPTPSTASVILDILIIVSPFPLLMLPHAEELGSTLCNLLKVLGLILCFLRPAVFRSRLRYNKAYVMYEFFLLNYSYTALHIQ